MSSWLIRAVQTLRFGGIFGATAFAASALMTVSTSQLFAVPAAAATIRVVPSPKDSETVSSVHSLPTGEGVSESSPSTHNPFCPTCRPQTAAHSSDAPMTAGGPAGAPTSLPLRLHATMEAHDPSASLATIADLETGQTGLFGVGDLIDDRARVASITRGWVQLDHRGTLEHLTVFGEPAVASSRPARPAEPSAEAKPSGIEGADEAISCADDHSRCEVERSFVDDLLANPAMLVSQARAIPGRAADGSEGFVLSRVRSGSLPQRIGLQNGDVIVSVAGRPATIDNLTSLYGTLRRAQQVTFEIEREGRRIERALVVQ